MSVGPTPTTARATRRWDIAPRAPQDHFKRLPDLPPLIVQLLYNRGLIEPEDVTRFLSKDTTSIDPFRLHDIDVALKRLRRAILENEFIAVYGDYDVDGVTATVLLTQTLRDLGARVMPYIPDRFEEGYGVNRDALDKLVAQGVTLIITVDCGVRAIDEIAHGNALGLEFIITDHHGSEGDHLPQALAIINPNQPACAYPDKNLAGVGIAYRLAQALVAQLGSDGRELPYPVSDLLDLVALGTVADLAGLMGENRDMVKQGLALINARTRPGIAALCDAADVSPGQIDSTTIGFALGPRLNAAGRVEHARAAYELLSSPTREHAREFAYQLNAQNRERQRLTAEMVEKAVAQALQAAADTPLLFAGSEHFSSGVIGLAASRLVEAHHRPAIVMSIENGEARGSARSIPQFHITQALDRCKELLVKHGGHAAAAGFTVKLEHLDDLKARLIAIAEAARAEQDWSPVLNADAYVRLSTLNWTMQGHLERLEPHGMQNHRPIFVSRNVRVRNARGVKDGAHLKLNLLDENGQPWDAIAFRLGDRLERLSARIDIAYTLEVNTWNGERRLQLNVKDIKPGQE